MQSQSASLKLTYKNEIRRFQVGYETSYDELVAVVCELFSIDHSVVLKWKDEEDDLVTISTDEEVEHAVSYCKLLRLFVFDVEKRPVQTTFTPSCSIATECQEEIEGEDDFETEESSEESESEESEDGWKKMKVARFEANLQKVEEKLSQDNLPPHKQKRLEHRREMLQTKLENIQSGNWNGRRGPRGRGCGRGRGAGRRGRGHGPHGPHGHGPHGHGPHGRRGRGHGPRGHGPNGHGPRGHFPREHGSFTTPADETHLLREKILEQKAFVDQCRLNMREARASKDKARVASAQQSLKDAQEEMKSCRQKMQAHRQEMRAQKQAQKPVGRRPQRK